MVEMRYQKGFTLIEISVVMAIIAIMVVILIGLLNPILLYERAIDDRRKKDLNYIRLAFEDYYTDKACYPSSTLVTTVLMDKANCGKTISQIDYAKQWPCDPISKEPYKIAVDSTGCSHKFKVFTRLANISDNPITLAWLPQNRPYLFGFINTIYYQGDKINYGVANYGINWEESVGLIPTCVGGVGCFARDVNGGNCNNTANCTGPNCYVNSPGCNPACVVARCP